MIVDLPMERKSEEMAVCLSRGVALLSSLVGRSFVSIQTF